MFKIDFIQAVQIIKQYWISPWTIIGVLCISALGMIWLFITIDFESLTASIPDISSKKWIFFFGVLISIFLLWIYCRRIPTAPQNTLGIAIAISTENDDEKQKIYADFITPLRKLVEENHGAVALSIVEIPEHHIVNDKKKMLEKLKKANCFFMVSGKVRLRNRKQTYFIDLDGAVLHRPIPENISDSFGKEFREVLEKRIAIPMDNDLLHFELTSEYINIVSRYMIGCAALISGNITRGLLLLEETHGLVGRFRHTIPGLQKIKENLPRKLADVYFYQVSLAIKRWVLQPRRSGKHKRNKAYS